MSDKFALGVEDYAILGMLLAISAAIGVYFRISGGQQKTKQDYLFAGRNMPTVTVAFSLMATYMSTVSLMGMSAEMYLFGTHMAFAAMGHIVGPVISTYVFLPIYFELEVSTTYEYLERRFGKSTRRILSGLFLLQNVMINGIFLYGPTLALSAVTNLSVYASVICIGTICTFYCTLGGLKAVLWTDVFQACLMYICLFAIIVKGCLDLGGLHSIVEAAYDGGRMVLPTFNLDFSTRYTMYSVFLLSLINTMSCYGANQIQVQRQLALKNVVSAKIASAVSGWMIAIFHLLCCLCGLIFYAYYRNCDPMSSPSKPIHSADQLMPYYIISTMNQYPGLTGLCIAGIFSASLSTLSSCINSMAAVTYEDIIRPMWPKPAAAIFITKIASIFYGTLAILTTFLVGSMGNLYKAAILAFGMVSGPSLGVFLLAALTSTASEMGANMGMIVGFLVGGCLTFIPERGNDPYLPVGRNCSNEATNVWIANISDSDVTNHTFLTVSPTSQNPALGNFSMSFMWITPISLLVCVLVGYFGSWIISCSKGDSEIVPAFFLSPVRRHFLSKVPLSEESMKEMMELVPARMACNAPCQTVSQKQRRNSREEDVPKLQHKHEGTLYHLLLL